MDPALFPSPDRPILTSDFLLIPFISICVTSLLLPSGTTRVSLTLPPILYILFRLRNTTSGNNVEDYLLAVNACGLFYKYVSFVLLRTPETDIYRVIVSGDKKGEREPEDPAMMDMWTKLKWNLHFWTSLRGAGWNWQVKNVDELPPKLLAKR